MSDGGNVVKNTRASSNFKWTCVLTSKLLEILTVLSKDPTFGTSAGSFKAKAFNKAVASLMESAVGKTYPNISSLNNSKVFLVVCVFRCTSITFICHSTHLVQVKNKWTVLKSQYKGYLRLLSMSGVGDASGGRFPDEAWAEKVEKCPDIKPWRYYFICGR